MKMQTINSERQTMTNIITRGVLAAAVVFSAGPLQAQLRFETVNFANLMAPVTRAYVAPGKTKEYNIYGPWIELATKVTLNGVAQEIVGRQPFATAKEGLLRVKLTGATGAPRGTQALIINIVCPPLVGCAPVQATQVMVLGVGTLIGITPNNNVAVNQPVPFTITGQGLDNSTVFLFRTDLRAVNVTGNSPGTLSFTGSTAACGTNRVRVRDVAEGGDFYPFPGGLDIDLATSCGVRPGSGSSIGGGGAGATGGPDLQPVVGTPVFRHIAANRKIANTSCQGMFAQAVNAIVRTITVGDMVWGVRNTGATNVTTAFRIQLWRGSVMVDERPVAQLNAGASVTFTYDRNPSQTEVARLGLVPPAASQQIYNATGGECVQTVGQSTQFDWQDPTWEIRVDAGNVVTNDINTANNRKSF